jgi:hypothetical protein
MTLPEHQPILDYASPGVKTPLKLAEGSIIRINDDGETVEIIETLAGKMTALSAILFTSCTATTMGIALLGTVQQTSSWAPMVFFFGFVAVVVRLILAVIRANWRKTILRVKSSEATLRFTTPFNEQSRRWNSEEVEQYRVTQELDPATQRIVYEMQIAFWSRPLIKLFTGQSLRLLTEIALQLESRTTSQP